jgi:hypothetical protein
MPFTAEDGFDKGSDRNDKHDFGLLPLAALSRHRP